MNTTIKKIIFVIFALCWSFGIINDVMQRGSVTSNIWAQYNATWLLIVLSAITIIFLVDAAITYVMNDKAEAYKKLLIAFIVNMLVGFIELIFASMINKQTLIQWITMSRQGRGLPSWEAPIIAKYTMLGYIAGIVYIGVLTYIVYRHWKKIKRLQTKSDAAFLKKEKGKK